MLRNSSSRMNIIDLRQNSSSRHLSASLSSSKNSLQSYSSMSSSMLKRKGYSFGNSSRNSLMQINKDVPAPKYHIQGIVEINLNARKGSTFGSSRQSSIEKTPFSYLNKNHNPGPGAYQKNILQKSGSSVKIGTSQNENLSIGFLNEKVISKNPGPGAYHPKVVKLKGGKLTTNSKRFQKPNKENRPGPGAYNLENLDVVSKGSNYQSLRM